MTWRELSTMFAAIGALAFARVTASEMDLATLCHDAPSAGISKLAELCSSLRNLLHDSDPQYPWDDVGASQKRFMRFGRDTHLIHNTDKNKDSHAVNDMHFGIPNKKGSNSGGMYFGIRQRRSGNYIRFGRSVPDSHPSVEDYMTSFGEPDQHEATEEHSRLGRSTKALMSEPDSEFHSPSDSEKRFMRFGKKDVPKMYYAMRYKKPGGMYFGIRQKKGSQGQENLLNGKRFMRFGRNLNEDEGIDDKRFMRFGRGGDDDIDGDKRFMRFGKRFMRFGRGDDAELEDKRFMRFGKRQDELEDERGRLTFGKTNTDEDMAGEKRYMRFGKRHDELNDEKNEKRGFMRFGKKESEIPDKKFMRFGKKDEGPEDDEKGYIDVDNTSADMGNVRMAKKSDDEEKRYMRFGKKNGSDEVKRFMRFGKKDGSDSSENDKRFMRFGK